VLLLEGKSSEAKYTVQRNDKNALNERSHASQKPFLSCETWKENLEGAEGVEARGKNEGLHTWALSLSQSLFKLECTPEICSNEQVWLKIGGNQGPIC